MGETMSSLLSLLDHVGLRIQSTATGKPEACRNISVVVKFYARADESNATECFRET